MYGPSWIHDAPNIRWLGSGAVAVFVEQFTVTSLWRLGLAAQYGSPSEWRHSGDETHHYTADERMASGDSQNEDRNQPGRKLGPSRSDFVSFYIIEEERGKMHGGRYRYQHEAGQPIWTYGAYSEIWTCSDGRRVPGVGGTRPRYLLVGLEISNCDRDEPERDEHRSTGALEPNGDLLQMLRKVYREGTPQSGFVDPPNVWVEKDRQLFVAMLFVDDRDEVQALCSSVIRGERRLSELNREQGPRVEDVLERALGAIPQAYEKKHEALLKFSLASRAVIARVLEPALNEEAKSHPQNTYEDKKALAKWINAQLRSLGLAIQDPKTGKPCHLVGSPGNRPGIGRFMLNITDESGRLVHSVTSVTLPHLQLIPDDLSRAPYGERSERARR
jgi:hypothetical protein